MKKIKKIDTIYSNRLELGYNSMYPIIDRKIHCKRYRRIDDVSYMVYVQKAGIDNIRTVEKVGCDGQKTLWILYQINGKRYKYKIEVYDISGWNTRKAVIEIFKRENESKASNLHLKK